MPYNRVVVNLLLGLGLVLIWTCGYYVKGHNVRVNMSDKDNTETQGCCRRNHWAFITGTLLFTSLLLVSLLTFLSWVYVRKSDEVPFPKETSKHNFYSSTYKYFRPHGNPSSRNSYQRSSIATTNEMQLNVVHAGLINGAVCLDGSPPAYYLRKGRDLGSNRWIIHFNGGAWCFDESACLERSRSSLGSSRNLPPSPPVIQGINSPDPQVNPDFFDWNLVWVVYCDGASFTGNRDSPVNVDGDFVYFRGSRIIDAIFEDLMLKGFSNAERLILTGSSAGSMTALFSSDHIARKFAPGIPVRVLSDAGFFVETSTMGGKNVGAMFKQIYDMQNSSAGLNQACMKTLGLNHGWRCFLPEVTFRFIKTPSFILNAAYDVWALIYFMGINCKFPSNSYSREKRGIDLMLPYLHSSKKRTKGTHKRREILNSDRQGRDISGFEILPFFRPSLNDRETLPMYQAYDQDNYFDPDRSQGFERLGESPGGIVDDSYNRPQLPAAGVDLGGTLSSDENSPSSLGTSDQGSQQMPAYVDEQPGPETPANDGQFAPLYDPTANTAGAGAPTSSPSQAVHYDARISQENTWTTKNPQNYPTNPNTPLIQNTWNIQDLNNEISSQNANLNSELHGTAVEPEDHETQARPSPLDSLVNVLKNVTRHKADNKKTKPVDNQPPTTKQRMQPAEHSPHSLFSPARGFIKDRPVLGSKLKSVVTVHSKKALKPSADIRLLHSLMQNKTAETMPQVKLLHLKIRNSSAISGINERKQRLFSKEYNTTGSVNATDDKNKNKRSTSIAKEYISILRSDPPECTDTDMVDVMKYRETMLRATQIVRNSPRSGVFLASCIDHSLSLFDETWSTIIVNGKTIAQAFGDWYFGRQTNHHDVDCPYPCNPSCP